jgi:hypothetical protein
LNQEHLDPSPEPIPLNDRDTFYINQFPFRWEQRWDYHQIDWSRFDQEPPINTSTQTQKTLLLDILPEPSSPATPISKSPCKLLISPTKTNSKDFLFQWEANHHSQESSLDSSHVSFRKRSHPRSIKTASQKTTHATDDSDQSSEDEEHQINFKDPNHPTSPPTTQQHHQPLQPSESPLSPSSPSSPPINLDLTSLEEPQPRRKSLLQKLLIKQAVQTHLAHQSDPIEPLAASGFSSSEDDEDDQEDDPDSPDDDLAQDTNKLGDASSDEDHPTRMDNCNLSTARESVSVLILSYKYKYFI